MRQGHAHVPREILPGLVTRCYNQLTAILHEWHEYGQIDDLRRENVLLYLAKVSVLI